MTISIKQIKHCLQKPLSINQLAQQCRCKTSELSPIIDLWQKKGRIIEHQQTKCKDCPLSLACKKKLFIWQNDLGLNLTDAT